MTRNHVSPARFARAVGKIGLFWKTASLGPVDAVPFHGHSHRKATGKHTYNTIEQSSIQELTLLDLGDLMTTGLFL